MLILSAYDRHDASAAVFDDYRMVSAVALERLTRKKGDGYRFPDEAATECLDIAGASRRDVDVVCLPRNKFDRKYFRFAPTDLVRPEAWQRERELVREMAFRGASDPHAVFDAPQWLADHGFRADAQVFFYNHHFAHALTALSATTWDDALLWTADGYGDRVYYSLYRLAGGQIEVLLGGEEESLARRRVQKRECSMGRFYHAATEALGFVPNRHEGKVLGLAAFGEPVFFDELRSWYRVEDDGRITGLKPLKDIRSRLVELAASEAREVIAASVQTVLEDVMTEAVGRFLARAPAKNLGVAGGVFANVKLNQRLAERFPFDDVFVYPAMSDQGEPAGGALHYLFHRDGPAPWLAARRKLPNVYFGRDHDGDADAAFAAAGARLCSNDVVAEAARMIEDGKIVGTYLGRMEYGPRALGARSIMASATDRSINDWLNQRLSRTEFMPFAPVVRAERAKDVFRLGDNQLYAAEFMTITCDVRDEWRDKVPAVVHVDGTARPQIIRRDQNPVYYDVLHAYEQATGVPVLINTSFNAHEEPIINAPIEAARALLDQRVDAVITQGAVWTAPL